MKNSQKAKVLNWLKSHGQITQIVAINQFRCFRLAVVINRLRNEGHEIDTELIGKEKYAKYTLKCGG